MKYFQNIMSMKETSVALSKNICGVVSLPVKVPNIAQESDNSHMGMLNKQIATCKDEINRNVSQIPYLRIQL